jgi:hypothetical protein
MMKCYKNEIEKNIDELTKIKKQLIDDFPYAIELLDKYDDSTLNVHSAKKIICNCSYEFLGSYDNSTNIFIWSNSQSIVNKNNIEKLLEIRKSYKTVKSVIINNKYNDISYLERMYFYLKNNIFMISQQNIQELLNYCICISKMHGVLEGKNTSKTYFYLITNYNKL